MKLAFLGTSEFAVPALKALVEGGHDVVAVYTRAPRPAGRGQQERRTPVHELALSLGLAALTAFVFARLGGSQALALGLAAGNRNMGLMLAAAGAAVPDLTWLYFAVAQFPIYLMPAMLKPLARRFAPRTPA